MGLHAAESKALADLRAGLLLLQLLLLPELLLLALVLAADGERASSGMLR